MNRGMLLAIVVGAVSGCVAAEGRCDQIRPGADVSTLNVQGPALCSSCGGVLARLPTDGGVECSPGEGWRTVSAEPSPTSYARDCLQRYGQYHCTVNVDSQDRVVCVKEFCAD